MAHPALLSCRVDLSYQRSIELEVLIPAHYRCGCEVHQTDKTANDSDHKVKRDDRPLDHIVVSTLNESFFENWLLSSDSAIFALISKHHLSAGNLVCRYIPSPVQIIELAKVKPFEVVQGDLTVLQRRVLCHRIQFLILIHDKWLRGYVVI